MTTTERSDRPRVWLLMSLLPEERQYGGNDGYEDDVSRFYSWNSRVPNAEAISAGDSVILWDKKGSLGHSIIESITPGYGTIDRRTCPRCGTGKISFRKTKSPGWRCQICRAEFDDEHVERVDVVTYRADYAEAWAPMPGYLTAQAVRLLALSPKSQHAMREADIAKVEKLLRSLRAHVLVTRQTS